MANSASEHDELQRNLAWRLTAFGQPQAAEGWLLLVLLVGFFWRVHDLGRQSLWLDEAYTWGVVALTSWRDVWGAMLAVSDVSPLPYVLIKVTASFWGLSEFGLRVSSAFFGWLAIPVTFRLGQRMMGRPAGLLAAALVALMPFAVWYAQDARPYGLYLFLAALVLWGFRRAEFGRGWWLLVASSAALYLTHYGGMLYAYAQAVYILTRHRQRPRLFRHWFVAQAAAALPVFAWAAAFLAQRRPLTANSWIPDVSLWTPLQTLWNFVSGDAARWTTAMIVGVSVLIGLLGWGARSRSGAAQLLLWWLVLPLAAAWLLSYRLPAYIDRFFEPAILALALLLARGLLDLPRALRMAAIPLALAGLLAGTARLFTDGAFAKEDWRGAARAIEASRLVVGVPDAESLLGLAPYVSRGVTFEFARDEADYSERLADGAFLLILRSPHESAHALSKSAPFDPLTEGPESLRRWLGDHPAVPVQVRPFTGLALVTIGE